ncbi:nuclear transport factor 2 family protein [Mucilaginibacter sp. X4EP1]|uniref:nuclear transport factor 2 family protein n=1 Tax=Mucilaginibacter sp. X4EP1 TaxID=2723092 RepID=UPI00216AAF9C|nr:nuclear transport factor 2 family protein [Mucilaginibacter sp. X4EP1]MCS3815520.1 hypothetical protein [Mucilaginibacter sp. X4EP1]
MKTLKILLPTLLLSSVAFCKSNIRVGDTTKNTPVAVVQRQVDAYNARDINSFSDTYADSVVFYNFPDKYLGRGKEFIKKGYTDLFLHYPKLHCNIVERIIQGNTVIDKENVIVTDTRHIDAVAIYQVENGKIVKVFFLK